MGERLPPVSVIHMRAISIVSHPATCAQGYAREPGLDQLDGARRNMATCLPLSCPPSGTSRNVSLQRKIGTHAQAGVELGPPVDPQEIRMEEGRIKVELIASPRSVMNSRRCISAPMLSRRHLT